MLIGSCLQIDLALNSIGRSLADGINHTTRRRFAVQNGRRAFEQFYALQAKGLWQPLIEPLAIDSQAVLISRLVETTYLQPVGIVVLTILSREHSGTVAEGFIKRLHVALFHFLLLHHRAGPGGFHQRGFHFQSGCGYNQLSQARWFAGIVLRSRDSWNTDCRAGCQKG